LETAEAIDGIVCLKHGSRGSVFRTSLRGSNESVIAKTGPSQAIATEAFVMGKIQPAHGIPSPGLIGEVESRSIGAWVFIEDLGDAEPSTSSRDACVAYGHALARVHSVPALGSGSDVLPRRGYATAFEDVVMLADGFAWVRRGSPPDSPEIEGITVTVNRVIEQWDRIEHVLAEQPVVLTHGDLAHKHVRSRANGQAIFIDWADAAWDVPAVDLYGLAYLDGRAARAYADAIRPTHASLAREIRTLVRVGRILRGIRALRWTLERYETGARERSLARFAYYDHDIRSALAGLETKASACGVKPSRIDLRLLAGPKAAGPADARDGIEVALRECTDGWAAVSGRSVDIGQVQFLKLTRRSRVLRLARAGRDAVDVIGKRRLSATMGVEKSVLHEIGPTIPVSMIALYGAVERDDFTWHYLEDGGSDFLDTSDPAHMGALVGWLGGLHRALGGPSPVGLPGHTADRYWDHLSATYARLDMGLMNPATDAEDRADLREVRLVLDDVATNWPALTAVSSSLPDTLVHGDLQAKNILMRRHGNDLSVLPIDWETSGWGTPAADIALLDRSDRSAELLDRYHRSVPSLRMSRDDLHRASAAGRIFRYLAAMDWATQDQFEWGSISKPVKRLRSYAVGIREATDQAGLAGAST
jgi:aminoglycoside phosphotransferase (APT) family kinase protein